MKRLFSIEIYNILFAEKAPNDFIELLVQSLTSLNSSNGQFLGSEASQNSLDAFVTELLSGGLSSLSVHTSQSDEVRIVWIYKYNKSVILLLTINKDYHTQSVKIINFVIDRFWIQEIFLLFRVATTTLKHLWIFLSGQLQQTCCEDYIIQNILEYCHLLALVVFWAT